MVTEPRVKVASCSPARLAMWRRSSERWAGRLLRPRPLTRTDRNFPTTGARGSPLRRTGAARRRSSGQRRKSNSALSSRSAGWGARRRDNGDTDRRSLGLGASPHGRALHPESPTSSDSHAGEKQTPNLCKPLSEVSAFSANPLHPHPNQSEG